MPQKSAIFFLGSNLGLYMCLKIKICYLKIFIKIRMDEKYIKIREMLFKN